MAARCRSRLRDNRGDEAIAAAGHGLDPAVAAGNLAEDLAQRRDLNREVALLDRLAGPRGFDQRVLRNECPGPFHQRPQQGERPPTERQGLASAEQQVVLGVQAKRPERVDHHVVDLSHFGRISEILPIRFRTRDRAAAQPVTGTQRVPDRLPPAGSGQARQSTRSSRMSLRINAEAPNFTANTTQGPIDFHQWIGDGWAILFSHPKDFTPVCTTELGYMAGLKPEFAKRNTKIIGLSVDPVENHSKWAQDIEETQGHAVNYPMIGDTELKVAMAYDMLPEGAGTTSDGRTAADNATVRSVFVIGPDKKVKAMLTYPMTTGRNFDEVLRLLDSCQLTAKHTVATPVNWRPGEDVIIPPAVSNEQAAAKYPNGWKTVKPYLRVVAQPVG